MDFEPLMDLDNPHLIPVSWRPILRRIVEAFAKGDFEFSQGLSSVVPVSPSMAEQMREYVADYGETLVNLPDETWNTSECQWMGSHWELMVDLWTAESERSDMVLALRVYEDLGDYRFDLHLVYVP